MDNATAIAMLNPSEMPRINEEAWAVAEKRDAAMITGVASVSCAQTFTKR
jgi:hypothetical protein